METVITVLLFVAGIVNAPETSNRPVSQDGQQTLTTAEQHANEKVVSAIVVIDDMAF